MTTYTAQVVIRESGADQAAAAIDRVGNSANRAHTSTSRLEQGFSMLRTALVSLGAAFSGIAIIRASDEFNNLQKRITQVTGSAQEQTAVWERLIEISNRHSVELGATSNAFTGLQRALSQFGITSTQTLNAIESMSAILQANGRGADETAGAMKRLAASMQTGEFSGRTFMTLLMQFPELMQGIAQTSGYSVEQLKALGENGSISMRQLVDWITRASASLQENRSKTDEVEDAWTRLKNTFMNAVGVANQVTGASNFLAEALDYVGQMCKAVVVVIFLVKEGLKDLAEWFGNLIKMIPGFSTFMERWNFQVEKWANGWKTLQGEISGGVEDFVRSRTATDQVTNSIQRADTATNQLVTSQRQLGAATNSTNGPLRLTVNNINGIGQASTQASGRVDVLSGGIRRTVQVTQEAARGMDTLTASDRGVAHSFGEVGAASGAASTGLNAVGMGAENANARITVMRGGMDGFTRQVVDLGAAAEATSVKLQRTTSTVDAMGNTTRTTTESIRSADGSIQNLKRTVETFENGVRTLREFIVMTDGSMRLLSETVTDVTRRVDDNTGVLSKNAMALSAVTSSAQAAASAYGAMASSAGSAASALSSMPSGGGGGGGGGSRSWFDADQNGDGQSDWFGGSSSVTSNSPALRALVQPAYTTDEKESLYRSLLQRQSLVKRALLQITGMAFEDLPSAIRQSLADPNLRKDIDGGHFQGPSTVPSLDSLLSTMHVLTGQKHDNPYGNFAYGGSFEVPGSGVTDATHVRFNATAGERVTIETPEQVRARENGGGGSVNVTMHVHGVRNTDDFRKSNNQIVGQLADKINRARSQMGRR